MRRSITRRHVLGSFAGLTTTAGCVSAGTTGSTGSSDGGRETQTPQSTSSATGTETGVDDLGQWLSDANGHDGEIPRAGLDESVSIWVGDDVRNDDEYLAFNPAAIEVAPGTTVYWEWSGHGGEHNVVALDGAFDSGEPFEANTGTIYKHTFDETGTYPYVCEPHRERGMKGVIVVEVPPSTDYPKVDEWVVETSNWDGSIDDQTDTDSTTVTAGASGNAGNFTFDPPALKVSTGTTVSWDWTGEGGGHNVAFEEADVPTSDIYAEPDVHFEYTFEETGIYRYSCEPHRALGMKGAIIVE